LLRRSQDLERLVEHIHRLIERDDVEVIWNKRIPDPSNPDQPRQIDVLIRRDGAVIHIECRLHRAKQDVGWVEELIGRRASLGADLIIGVSAGGFTRGAERKAADHGIMLRDLPELSEREIASWGERLALSIEWLHIENLRLVFLVPEPAASRLAVDDIVQALRESGAFYSVLQSIKDRLDVNKLETHTAHLNARVRLSLSVGQVTVERVDVAMDAWLTEEDLGVPCVLAYGPPEQSAQDRQVTVGETDQQGLCIARTSDAISARVDMTQLCPPENAMFNGFRITSDEVVTFKSIQLLGKTLPRLLLDEIKVGLRAVAAS